MTALRIVNHLTAPGLNHTGQYIRELRLTHSLVREYLGIMAAYVFNYHERLTGKAVHQAVGHLLCQFITEMVYHIRWMCYVLGYVKLTLAGLVKVLTGLFQKFGMLLPHMAHLGKDSE